jgi:Cu2+-containing amine oxidase
MKLSGLAKVQSLAMRNLFAIILCIALNLILTGWVPLAAAKVSGPVHPLDPLTKPEIATIVAAVKSTAKFSPDTRFGTIYLKEPPKSQTPPAERVA